MNQRATDWRHVERGVLLLVCVACVGIATGFGAEDEVGPPAIPPKGLGYSVEHWTMENGLPARTVTSLAQTPDGFLWCGTQEGLVRYDGAQFRVFQSSDIPALHGVDILEMRSDVTGRLWIEGVSGELLSYKSGHFHRFTTADGVPPGQAGKLGETRDGSFWFKGRTDDRFYHYVNGRFKAVVYPGIPASSIDRFYADQQSARWGVDETRRVMVRFTNAGPEFRPLPAPDGSSQVWAGRPFWLTDGSLGVTSSHAIYTLDGDRWKPRCIFAHPIATKDILGGVEDRQGNFWLSLFRRGLVRVRPNGKVDTVDLPDSNRRFFYRDLLVDEEGDVWVAGDDGLYRLHYYTFQPQPARLEETRRREATSFFQDAQGRLWILYDRGWARQTESGWRYAKHDQPGALEVGTSSKDGSVYLAYVAGRTPRETSVEKKHPDGKTEWLGTLIGLPQVMLESRSGSLWIGTDEGFWQMEAGGFSRVELPRAPKSYAVQGLAKDRDGRILAGVLRCGLYRRDNDGQWQLLTGPEDRGSLGIAGICADQENTIWVATDSGLARYRNNKWYEFSGPGFELPKHARSVVTDNTGGLWISAPTGVIWLGIAALNALAEGRSSALEGSWFDSADGLPSITCSDRQGGLYRASDGRIWVGTFTGAAVVDPKAWRQRRQRLHAPPVYIESVLADDRTLMDRGVGYRSKPDGELRVAPGAGRIEVRYTAINLSGDRKNRFRYRLEGLDDEWADVGEQRTAVYHRLPPGHYRFQVTAANQYGMRNEQGAAIAFYVQPYWWQVRWFQAGLALTIIGMAGFAVRRRVRSLERARARQAAFSRQIIDSQEQERNRIARELHDSLGQNLTLIKFANNTARRKTPEGQGASEQLREINLLVSKAIHEVRAITADLRPVELDRLGLTKALRSMMTKIESASGFRVDFHFGDLDQHWTKEEEINIYRMAQEGINNALKHARATTIRLEAVIRNRQLNLVVEDDGVGLPGGAAHTGEQHRGIGLNSLRERARLLNGQMRIQSSPGKGTRLEFNIPVTS